MKKFFTFIPRQPDGKLSIQKYTSPGNQKLNYKETRFPIMPVINGYASKGEAIKVIAVCEEYANSIHNLEYLKAELDGLKENDLDIDLTVLTVPYDDSVKAQLATFQKLIEKIEDNDELFACITYGGKPIPIVETMVLRYAAYAKTNTIIRCVVYGQKDHETGNAVIYDITPLLQMDDIIKALSESRTKDIESAIALIMGL